jgi:hypothetical protein
VLPNDDKTPSVRCKSSGVAAIALDIALELRKPILGIRAWRNAVHWASMPEAAPTLDHHTRSDENDVWAKPQAWQHLQMLAEAKTAPV